MQKEIHFAPIQEHADHIYRRHHAEVYGGIDSYYTPFIRVEKGEARRQDIKRLRLSLEDDPSVTAQIIFGAEAEFLLLRDAVKGCGAQRIDLNLGCPFPMQTRRSRGAALVRNAELMTRVAGLVQSDPETQYSVKMRLGLEEPDEWRAIMPMLNDMPLRHVTLHPRVATQMYGGELYGDAFREFLEQSRNPVIYNGDLTTIQDLNSRLEEMPGLKGVMIGRGLLARPSLAQEWQQGKEMLREERIERLLEFHARLLGDYVDTLCGEKQILAKVKTFWEYLEPEIGHKAAKAIHKAGSLNRYRQAVEEVRLS